jgi:hypothetical protein
MSSTVAFPANLIIGILLLVAVTRFACGLHEVFTNKTLNISNDEEEGYLDWEADRRQILRHGATHLLLIAALVGLLAYLNYAACASFFSDAMSMTKRYLTSLFSMRS